MRRTLLCGALLFAANVEASEPTVPLEKPRVTWAPTLPTKEDRKGLEALADQVHEAWAERHLDDVSAAIDFPFLMVTDDGKGNVTREEWDRERYLRVVGDALNQLPPNAVIPRPKRSFVFITDALASVHEERKLTLAGKKLAWRTTFVCARKQGGWRIISIVEGGWARNG